MEFSIRVRTKAWAFIALMLGCEDPTSANPGDAALVDAHFGSRSDARGGSVDGAPLDGASLDGAPVDRSDADSIDDAAISDPDATESDSGAVTCPTEPPFDERDSMLVNACTRVVYVAVGNALRRVRSFDGANWDHDVAAPNHLDDQNENSHRDVSIHNGVIVITGDDGVLVSRDGGATYQHAFDSRNHDSAVGFFRGAFWVVGTALTATSSDGVEWTSWAGMTELPGGLRGGWDATAIAASDTRLVAITGRNNARRVFDGMNWTEAAFGSEYSGLAGLAYGLDRFAMVGFRCCDTSPGAGLRASSADGSEWAVRSNASAGGEALRFAQVVFDGTRFVASASPYDNRGYFSSDGLEYSAHATNRSIGAITFGNEIYVGASGDSLVRSADAITWTDPYRAGDGTEWYLTAIAAGRVLDD